MTWREFFSISPLDYTVDDTLSFAVVVVILMPVAYGLVGLMRLVIKDISRGQL